MTVRTEYTVTVSAQAGDARASASRCDVRRTHTSGGAHTHTAAHTHTRRHTHTHTAHGTDVRVHSNLKADSGRGDEVLGIFSTAKKIPLI